MVPPATLMVMRNETSQRMMRSLYRLLCAKINRTDALESAKGDKLGYGGLCLS
jgi:hypothetical protein